MTIELIYDNDCPNVRAARAQLSRALLQARLAARWREWDRCSPRSPAHARTYGSPTILVNGKDISGAQPSSCADCCRLYPRRGGRLSGVPEVREITEALLKAQKEEPREKRSATDRAVSRGTLALLSTIAVALLPKLTCPACWPAYVGVLSALGLGFFNYTPFLLPLTVLFLLVSISSLFFATRRHQRVEPLTLGIASAAIVVAGKFAWNSDAVMFGGLALFAGASFWSTWLAGKTRCSACGDSVGEKSR